LDRFSLLERQRNEILEGMASADPALLAKQPAPGAWSLAQVVLHLAIADEGMLAYMTKKIEVGGHAPVGASAPFRLALLNVALALPVKYKAPPVVATVPECTMAEAKQRWDAIRERMHRTFETIPVNSTWCKGCGSLACMCITTAHRSTGPCGRWVADTRTNGSHGNGVIHLCDLFRTRYISPRLSCW
jgi:hypothetical protein